MKITHFSEVEAKEELPGVLLRTVIGAADGAPRFAMRVFEVQEGCATPLHRHWWEHEVFVLSGTGYVQGPAGRTELREGDVVFVGEEEEHCFVNTGTGPFRFICVIPELERVARPSASPRGCLTPLSEASEVFCA